MLCIKVNELLRYAGVVGAGMVVGALFTGIAIQLPMLVEATWEEKTKQITLDSRTVRICEVEEIATPGINGGEFLSQ